MYIINNILNFVHYLWKFKTKLNFLSIKVKTIIFIYVSLKYFTKNVVPVLRKCFKLYAPWSRYIAQEYKAAMYLIFTLGYDRHSKELLNKDVLFRIVYSYIENSGYINDCNVNDLKEILICEITQYYILKYDKNFMFESSSFISYLQTIKDLEESILKAHFLVEQKLNFCKDNIEFLQRKKYISNMIKVDDLEEGYYRLLATDTNIKLPYNSWIRLLITSMDVLHSWAVPSLGIKLDACPGRLNQVALFIKREGFFYGQCSEICGIYHGFMPIVIESLDLDSFIEWVNSFRKDIKSKLFYEQLRISMINLRELCKCFIN